MESPSLSQNFPLGGTIARPRREWIAFTLVEMIVSVAIFSIISLLLITMLNQVATTWTQVQGQIDTRQTGRSILTMIASDLRGAAVPVDHYNLNSLQFLIDPTNFIGGSPNLLNPHAMFWQAPIATTATSASSYGTMAEVGYFVQWDTSNASNPRAVLCRFFVNPVSPSVAKSSSSNYYLINVSPTAWISPIIATNVAPGILVPNNMSSSYTGWAGDNVLGLWIRALDSGGYPITMTASNTSSVSSTDLFAYDSRQSYTTGYQQVVSGVPTVIQKTYLRDSVAGHTVVGCNLPAYVDIAVMVLDARTASRISALGSQAWPNIPSTTCDTNYVSGTSASSNPTNYWSEINTFYTNQPPMIQTGARIYSTRVQLINAY